MALSIFSGTALLLPVAVIIVVSANVSASVSVTVTETVPDHDGGRRK
jgi:hypothetical protein